MELDDGKKVKNCALVIEFVVEDGFGVRGRKDGMFFLPREVGNGMLNRVGGDEE